MHAIVHAPDASHTGWNLSFLCLRKRIETQLEISWIWWAKIVDPTIQNCVSPIFRTNTFPISKCFVEFCGPKAAAGAAVYHPVDAGSTGFGLGFFFGMNRFFGSPILTHKSFCFRLVTGCWTSLQADSVTSILSQPFTQHVYIYLYSSGRPLGCKQWNDVHRCTIAHHSTPMILAKFALQVVITSPTRPFKLVPLDSWGTVITIFGVQLETWADSELMSLAEVNQTIQMQLLPFALLLPFVAGLIVHPVESDYTHLFDVFVSKHLGRSYRKLVLWPWVYHYVRWIFINI